MPSDEELRDALGAVSVVRRPFAHATTSPIEELDAVRATVPSTLCC